MLAGYLQGCLESYIWRTSLRRLLEETQLDENPWGGFLENLSWMRIPEENFSWMRTSVGWESLRRTSNGRESLRRPSVGWEYPRRLLGESKIKRYGNLISQLFSIVSGCHLPQSTSNPGDETMDKKAWDHLGSFEGYDMRKMKYSLKVVQSNVLPSKKQIKGPVNC